MAEIHIEEEIPAAADRAWAKIADFGGIDDWIPGAAGTTLAGEGVGAVRTIPMGDASVAERLESFDASARTLSYSIVEGPMPIERYVATISVVELDAERCRIHWDVDYEPTAGVPAEALAKGVEAAYRGAIQGLAEAVG